MSEATLKERLNDWLLGAPVELLEWFSAVEVRRFLREERQRNFQMVGKYDGAMSEACKKICRDYADIADVLLEAGEPFICETPPMTPAARKGPIG